MDSVAAAGVAGGLETGSEHVDQARILVVSEDREFLHPILQGWQRLHFSPEYTFAAPDAAQAMDGCAVVIADGLAALPAPGGETALAIVIADSPLLELAPGPRAVRIPRVDGWADQAAVLVQETLLRLALQAQLAETKEKLPELERYATLGRFIVQARHGLGNALTGVMGNSELLLMEAGALRTEVRTQLETIHSMSLKMHETFHRLSSLEMELRMAERETLRRPPQ